MQNNEGYHKAKQTKKTNNKKAIALVCLALVVVCICAVVTKQSNEQTQLIRIHIRANSNSAPDQTVKLKVRDQITEYLTVELGGVKTHDQAYERLERLHDELVSVAEAVLLREGFDYGARAEISNEYFPSRDYEGIVVESGYYDAVIMELGSGQGDNWWCVIYPPLCFVKQGDGTYLEYKSKLQELWHKWFG